MKDQAKSKVLTSSLPPGVGAYSKALKAEKSSSPPSPVGGGAVVTNDWCITTYSKKYGNDFLSVQIFKRSFTAIRLNQWFV